MDTIKIRRKISGDTLKIRQLLRLKGKRVNIIIYPNEEALPRKQNRRKAPSWIGKYSTGGKLVDDRSSIYSR